MTSLRPRLAAAILAAGLAGSALPAGAQTAPAPAAPMTDHSGHGGAPMGTAAGESTSEASNAYMAAMATMDAAMAGMTMTGEPGTDFAAMMIPHHQAAIDMAEAYLASGDADPELTALSEAIIAAQEAEIATLEAWLAANEAN